MSYEPMTRDIYAEDLEIGVPIDLGSYLLTAEELHAFALQWDPQTHHVDPECGAQGYYGRPIASGLQSMSIHQRLSVQGAYRYWNVIAGTGMDELRFPRPVFAGDELTGTMTITEVVPDDRGRAQIYADCALLNQEGATVLSYRLGAKMQQRPAE